MFRFKSTLLLLAVFALSSCEMNAISSESSFNNGSIISSFSDESHSSNDNSGQTFSSNNQSNSNFNEEKEYVKGKRIFDLEYDIDGYPEETMKLDEFPELIFKRKGGTLLITGRDTIVDSKGIGARGMYLADVNSDGYTDLAYYQDRTNGSSNISYLVRIYDYHNDKFLFNDDNNKRSILDLDDEGILLIEELSKYTGGGFNELERAGRFLAGDEISFEWFNFDSKLKGMFLDLPNRKDGKYVAYLNQTSYAKLYLFGIGSDSLEKALPIDSINIKANNEYYSFEVSHGLIASQFNITFTFVKEGTVELEVSIGDITAKETIQILSAN